MIPASSGGNGPDRFVIIIGAMKSGTTSLFEILSQHPQVCGCKEKEPNYFTEGVYNAKNADWYKGLWNWRDKEHRVALEASTAYTKFPAYSGVPARIAEFQDASFKFIYIMRNPVQQIASHLQHAQYVGWEKRWDGRVPQYMIDIVSYATQLDKYMECFDRNSMFLVTLDEFEENPAFILKDIMMFLGISGGVTLSGLDRKLNTGELYSLSGPLRGFLESKTAERVKSWMPAHIKHYMRRGLGSFLRNVNGPSVASDLLGPAEKRRILVNIEDEINRLERDYDIRVPRAWLDGR